MELEQVKLTDIKPDPKQPRKYFDQQALQELADSIKIHGVLQPILARKDETTGEIFIVSGERRYQASKIAGKETIPVIFTTGKPGEIALVENLLRENLTAIEEAEAMDRIMTEYNYSQEDLSKVVGKAPSTISEILSLNKLPQEIRDKCRENPKISRGILVEIAKKKTEKQMLALYNKFEQRGLTRAEIRTITRPRKGKVDKFDKDIKTFRASLDNLKSDDLSPEDWNNLKAMLTDLTKYINGRIKAIEQEIEKAGKENTEI